MIVSRSSHDPDARWFCVQTLNPAARHRRGAGGKHRYQCVCRAAFAPHYLHHIRPPEASTWSSVRRVCRLETSSGILMRIVTQDFMIDCRSSSSCCCCCSAMRPSSWSTSAVAQPCRICPNCSPRSRHPAALAQYLQRDYWSTHQDRSGTVLPAAHNHDQLWFNCNIRLQQGSNCWSTGRSRERNKYLRTVSSKRTKLQATELVLNSTTVQELRTRGI